MSRRLSIKGLKQYVQNGEGSEAVLYGRYQIQRACSSQCLGFRYGKFYEELSRGFEQAQAGVNGVTDLG